MTTGYHVRFTDKGWCVYHNDILLSIWCSKDKAYADRDWFLTNGNNNA